MTTATYPSPNLSHRRADMAVHAIGLALILVGGSLLVINAGNRLNTDLVFAVVVYVLSVLTSNIASNAYHFAPLHQRRTFLRRIDHAAIYPSISGTFTPFFVQANTGWTIALLIICWTLTALAIWHKLTHQNVKTRWSTASYLGLGAIGLSALPDLTNVPIETLWCILAGAAFYVIGTVFYTRKSMPFRYAIWHTFVNLGAISMFAGVWMALFPGS